MHSNGLLQIILSREVFLVQKKTSQGAYIGGQKLQKQRLVWILNK